MKSLACAFAILFLLVHSASAQTGVTGTWRVNEGIGQLRQFTMFLRVDGSTLTGAVSACASPAVLISDGTVDGNNISFKCKSLGIDRTITFRGTIKGDEMVFTLVVQGDLRVPPAAEGLFGLSAPKQFNAKRVPDDELAVFADQVRGVELAAAVNLLPKGVKAEGTFFLPQKVNRVRAVIVVIRYGLGYGVYDDPQWRRVSETLESGLLHVRISNISTVPTGNFISLANLGGADALIQLLQRLASESGHPELESAPILLWGHSAAGSFAATFAAAHPQRTIGFVRYHSAGGGLVGADMKVLGQIPALLLSGGNDGPAVAQSAETFGRVGRSTGAPWTFAVEPGATHGAEESRKKADNLTIPWITAIVRQRVSSDGAVLRVVTDRSGWLGNNRTGEVAPYDTFPASKTEASWLPDEASARAWQAILGSGK